MCNDRQSTTYFKNIGKGHENISPFNYKFIFFSPNLSWRDLQHLVAQTSSSEGLENNSGWYRNAAGIQYNHRFGFGLLNAKSLTETAKIMDNSLGKQEKCIVKSK